MKKHGIWILISVAIFLIAFLLGIFFGRRSSGPIQVSKLPQSTEQTQYTSSTDETLGRININTADLDELQQLPGIGQVLAQRIIDYREEHGDFKSISELTNVSGIGTERLNKIMDYITVGGSQ